MPELWRVMAGNEVDLLAVPAAAVRLGCSRWTVYRLIASGDLSPVDIAPTGSTRSKTRVRSDEITALIKRRTRSTRHTA